MASKKKPTHVFIVENNKIYVNMLEYIFTKDLTYRFVNFNSGEECLANMHLDPGIIVLDHTLPGKSGLDTLPEIRKTHPDAQVIMLISDKDDKLPSQLFAAGADDYVLKDNTGIEGIAEKIEACINKDILSKTLRPAQTKPFLRNFAFILIALLLASAGVFYYQ